MKSVNHEAFSSYIKVELL